MKKPSATLVLWMFVVLYIVVFSLYASFRHYNFQTQLWDMGAFVQTFWNTIHGKIMFNNVEDVHNHLGIHWTPFLFVLVPGYWVFRSPYYLLIIQSIALGLGAIPVYYLAHRVLKNDRFALLMAGAYLLYPSLHWINNFDFHELPFMIPLFLAAFYFIEKKKLWWATFFIILTASVREDAGLILIFLGIYLAIRPRITNRERLFGYGVLIAALVYFILTLTVFMPTFSGGALLRFDRYYNLGATPIEAIRNMIARPQHVLETVLVFEKMKYLLWLFLPLAFLPLLAGRVSVLLIPGLLENLLTNFTFQFTGSYQYDSVLVGSILIASIYGLHNLLVFTSKRRENSLLKRHGAAAAGYAVLIALFVSFLLRSPLSPFGFPVELFRGNDTWKAYRRLVSLVPPRASVAALTNLIPHLSHREHSYMLGREPFPVDIVLVDTTDGFGFQDTMAFRAYLDRYLTSEKYKAILVDNRYMLIARKEIPLEGL